MWPIPFFMRLIGRVSGKQSIDKSRAVRQQTDEYKQQSGVFKGRMMPAKKKKAAFDWLELLAFLLTIAVAALLLVWAGSSAPSLAIIAGIIIFDVLYFMHDQK